MKNFKKIVGLLLIVALIPMFSACEEEDSKGNKAENGSKAEDSAETGVVSGDIEDSKASEKEEKDIGLTAEEAREKRVGYAERIYDAKLPVEYANIFGTKDEEKAVFDEQDKILNEIYADLKKFLPEDEFKIIEEEQIQWISQKEADAEEDYKEYGDLSDENIEENAQAFKYHNLAIATANRSYYLLMYIGESGKEKRLEFFNGYDSIFDGIDDSLTAGNQHEMNQHAYLCYEAAENYYNKIYDYHKDNMSPEDFSAFEKNENAWKAEKDAEVEIYMDRNTYGSMGPMIGYGWGNRMIYQRCWYITAMIG